MAYVSPLLPSTLFPVEADCIIVHRSATSETSATVRLFLTGGRGDDVDLVNARLAYNAQGLITLADLSLLIETHTDGDEPRTLELTVDGAAVGLCSGDGDGCTVVPCRAGLTEPAEFFCARSFLTLCDGVRRTQQGAQEWLYVFGIQDAIQATFAARWLLPDGTLRETSQTFAFNIVSGGFGRLDASPARLTPPAEGAQLCDYTVRADRRKMKYLMAAPQAEPVLSVAFRNAFGRAETFHFRAGAEQAVKAEYTAAVIEGHTRNIRIEAVKEWTARAAHLLPSELPLLADLCASPSLSLQPSGAEITLTACELKADTDPYTPQAAAVTFRHAARRAPVVPDRHAQTFDDTFDPTFE